MLEYMQKNMRWFLLPFAFLIIVVFVFWGVGTREQSQRQVVAEVGDAPIYADEYWRAYDRMVKFYRSVFQDQFDKAMEKQLNLKERALDELIDREVLAAYAEKLDIAVGDQEVADTIRNDTNFQRDGVFNRDVYLRTLQINRINPAAYEELRRRDLVLRKVRRVFDISTPLETELSAREGWQGTPFGSPDRITRAFLDGLRRTMDIMVNRDLISS